jgi:hypothetical protein
MVVNFSVIWSILKPSGIFCHLVYFPRFGMLYKEESGNPILEYVAKTCTCKKAKNQSSSTLTFLYFFKCQQNDKKNFPWTLIWDIFCSETFPLTACALMMRVMTRKTMPWRRPKS